MSDDEIQQDAIANRYEEIIQSLPGRILPKQFRIDVPLLSDPFSVIFRAFNEAQESVVNLRVFRTLIRNEDDYQYRRFKQEVKKLSSLNHPNIAKVFDSGLLEEGLPFLISEHVEGPSLEEILIHQNRIDPDQVYEIFTQVSKAVAYAHEHGILHEALKPARIIVSESASGEAIVKTTGFSLLSMLTKVGLPLRTPLLKLQFIGTAEYMSPEQCAPGHEIDVRSDIYSLGCMLYECLSGQVPFLAASPENVLRMQMENEAVPISSVRKDLVLPRRLMQITEKCMTKDPTRRYQFMKDLQADLESDTNPLDRDRQTVIPEAIQKAEQRVKDSKESPLKLIALIAGTGLALVGTFFACSFLLGITGQVANNGIWSAKLDSARKAAAEGRSEEAEASFREALNEAKKFKAPDSRYARSLNAVAEFEINKGRYAKAIPRLKEALDTEGLLKEKDLDLTAGTFDLLSKAELADAMNTEAEEHARNSVDLAEHINGEHSARLLQSYIQLFNVLLAKNKLAEAAGTIEKMKATIASTNTILSMELISSEKQAKALLLQANKKYAEAEKRLQEVLGDRQEKIGLSSLPTIETMNLLSQLYVLEKNYDKAAKLMTNALEIKQKILGENSPAVAEMALSLADVYNRAGKTSEAEKYYRQALEMAEKDWGKDKSETLPYIDSLAKFLRAQKKISAAEVYESEARDIRHPERVPKLGRPN
ncbi:MAG: serine/threonine-protein kinase [Candidatus Obscuribacterales bacterium]|nr:serine/threonine-protein kinase [Candidatus Obscuribacterales bacterium]